MLLCLQAWGLSENHRQGAWAAKEDVAGGAGRGRQQCAVSTLLLLRLGMEGLAVTRVYYGQGGARMARQAMCARSARRRGRRSGGGDVGFRRRSRRRHRTSAAASASACRADLNRRVAAGVSSLDAQETRVGRAFARSVYPPVVFLGRLKLLATGCRIRETSQTFDCRSSVVCSALAPRVLSK